MLIQGLLVVGGYNAGDGFLKSVEFWDFDTGNIFLSEKEIPQS